MLSTDSEETSTGLLVLCDFDETFWAHDPAKRSDSDLVDFAHAVRYLTKAHGLRFGFVTGSHPEIVLRALDQLTVDIRPAFIGGNLGTDLLVADPNSTLNLEPRWHARFPAPADFAARAQRIVSAAASCGAELIPQSTHGQGTYKKNYYLRATVADLGSDARVSTLRNTASLQDVSININHCNPAAGDPAGFLDVDIVPQGAGKREIAEFLQQHWGTPPSKTLAFGDSGNDIPMFACAEHAWLVANATPEAQRHHPYITTRPHLGGIIDVLREVTGREINPC